MSASGNLRRTRKQGADELARGGIAVLQVLDHQHEQPLGRQPADDAEQALPDASAALVLAHRAWAAWPPTPNRSSLSATAGIERRHVVRGRAKELLEAVVGYRVEAPAVRAWRSAPYGTPDSGA